MRLRASVTPLLVVLAAALPTLVSLCELRCISPGAAANTVSEGAEPSACSGHGTPAPDKAPASNPSESSHDCGGHAMLAKSGSVGFELQLARAFDGLADVRGAPSPIGEAFIHAGTVSAFSDLSPPFGRSPGVLRL